MPYAVETLNFTLHYADALVDDEVENRFKDFPGGLHHCLNPAPNDRPYGIENQNVVLHELYAVVHQPTEDIADEMNYRFDKTPRPSYRCLNSFPNPLPVVSEFVDDEPDRAEQQRDE